MRDPSTELTGDPSQEMNRGQMFDQRMKNGAKRRRSQWYQDHKEEMKLLTVRQRAFLKAYTEECTIKGASEASNISNTSHAQWCKKNSLYKRLYEDLDSHVVNTIEDELYTRSVYGTEEPVFYQGQICGFVTKKSDQLLMFLLRARRPEIYRERATIDINSTAVNPESISPIVKNLNLEEIRRLREIVDGARHRQITVDGSAIPVDEVSTIS